MKIICATLALLVGFSVSASAQSLSYKKLQDYPKPRVYADSISNIGANTVTGPIINVGNKTHNAKLVIGAYRVGAATNGLNVKLDSSPNCSNWNTGTVVHLDSIGTGLTFAEVAGADSVAANGAECVRARITGLTGTNDTTDVWYWLKVN